MVSFKHVCREAIGVADALASIGHVSVETRIWFGMVPPRASSAYNFDLLDLGCNSSR